MSTVRVHTQFDFYEAICRISDMISLPLDSDLEYLGYRDAAEWKREMPAPERLAFRRDSTSWVFLSRRKLSEKVSKVICLLKDRLGS